MAPSGACSPLRRIELRQQCRRRRASPIRNCDQPPREFEIGHLDLNRSTVRACKLLSMRECVEVEPDHLKGPYRLRVSPRLGTGRIPHVLADGEAAWNSGLLGGTWGLAIAIRVRCMTLEVFPSQRTINSECRTRAFTRRDDG